MVATLKQILSSQKKTDYRPEEPATAEVTQVGHAIVVLCLLQYNQFINAIEVCTIVDVTVYCSFNTAHFILSDLH